AGAPEPSHRNLRPRRLRRNHGRQPRQAKPYRAGSATAGGSSATAGGSSTTAGGSSATAGAGSATAGGSTATAGGTGTAATAGFSTGCSRGTAHDEAAQRGAGAPRRAGGADHRGETARGQGECQPPPRAGAAKAAAREDRGTKPSKQAANKPANEALNAVRRFQDNLRDIPVSSYAADGTPRTIVIRPTSIQDVYYYSAPR